jgi:hypothetical protein
MSSRIFSGAQGASWASPDCSTPVCALLGLRAGRLAVDEALVRHGLAPWRQRGADHRAVRIIIPALSR